MKALNQDREGGRLSESFLSMVRETPFPSTLFSSNENSEWKFRKNREEVLAADIKSRKLMPPPKKNQNPGTFFLIVDDDQINIEVLRRYLDSFVEMIILMLLETVHSLLIS